MQSKRHNAFSFGREEACRRGRDECASPGGGPWAGLSEAGYNGSAASWEEQRSRPAETIKLDECRRPINEFNPDEVRATP